jgi:hypothetical protein
MAVSVPVVKFLEKTHGVQECNSESEKQKLSEPKSNRGLLVQNIWQYIHGCQINKAARGDKYQAISCHILRQKSHTGANHCGKGGSELRHNGFLLAESIFNENCKVSELVRNFVEQYRKRRQTTPCFHNIQYTISTRKVSKRGSDGNSIRELENTHNK